MLGSGRGDHGRTRIRVNIHTSAGGGSGSRRGAVSGTHSHIRGGGSGQGCGGGRGRLCGVVGCGRSRHRKMRGRVAASTSFSTVYWADRIMSSHISSSESDRRCGGGSTHRRGDRSVGRHHLASRSGPGIESTLGAPCRRTTRGDSGSGGTCRCVSSLLSASQLGYCWAGLVVPTSGATMKTPGAWEPSPSVCTWDYC